MLELTKSLKSALGNRFVEIESHGHSEGDWEEPDRLWLEKTPDNETCEGEYIAVSLATEDGQLWTASHDSADRFGGHPTHWSYTGSKSEVEIAVMEYLRS